MPSIPAIIIFICDTASSASACIFLASASFSFPLAPAITAATATIGATTTPARISFPPAIPNPPAALAPPPNQANVALVFAAPERAAIAVPVDAVPNIIAPP